MNYYKGGFLEAPDIEDGAYVWNYELDLRRNIFPLFDQLKISGWAGTVLFLLLYFLRGGNGKSAAFLPMVVGLGVTAVPAVIYFLRSLGKGGCRRLHFRMNDENIMMTEDGKKARELLLSDVRSGRIRDRYDVIELRSRREKLPVYVPKDFFPFVRSFISDHVPEEADIRVVL